MGIGRLVPIVIGCPGSRHGPLNRIRVGAPCVSRGRIVGVLGPRKARRRGVRGSALRRAARASSGPSGSPPPLGLAFRAGVGRRGAWTASGRLRALGFAARAVLFRALWRGRQMWSAWQRHLCAAGTASCFCSVAVSRGGEHHSSTRVVWGFAVAALSRTASPRTRKSSSTSSRAIATAKRPGCCQRGMRCCSTQLSGTPTCGAPQEGPPLSTLAAHCAKVLWRRCATRRRWQRGCGAGDRPQKESGDEREAARQWRRLR